MDLYALARSSLLCLLQHKPSGLRQARVHRAKVRAHYAPRPENNAPQALCEVNHALRGGSGVGPAGLSYMAHRWFGMPRHAGPARKGCCSTLLRGSVLRGGGKPIRRTLQKCASRDKRQRAGWERASMEIARSWKTDGTGRFVFAVASGGASVLSRQHLSSGPARGMSDFPHWSC